MQWAEHCVMAVGVQESLRVASLEAWPFQKALNHLHVIKIS